MVQISISSQRNRTWFTFQRLIRGWSMDIRSWRGRDGIPIRVFGLADRTCRSDLALASAGLAVLAGVGVIGDSTGTTTMHCTITAGISRTVVRFITAPTSIAVAGSEAKPDHSAETAARLAGSLHRGVRVVSVRAHSATSTAAARLAAFLPVDEPASAAAGDMGAADVDNQFS